MKKNKWSINQSFYVKVLVIGSGGREHALAWKLAQSERVTKVFAAPGNAGTAEIGENVAIPVTDLNALRDFAQEQKIDLTVVGPDDALAAGMVDVFENAGLRVFGPRQEAARLESSKTFAKEFMERHGIPTAQAETFTDMAEAIRALDNCRFPLAVKADGLALGKGVVIAQNAAEAGGALRKMMEEKMFGQAGQKVLLEEFLTGQECSIHAIIDGANYCLLPAAQDHKQIGEGDTGPNTGGMGTFTPPPLATPEFLHRVEEQLLKPFVRGLQEDGLEFKGLLFPGLMVADDGSFKVLEFNCRFGDPETQSILPRLESDLVDLLEAAIDGTLDQVEPRWDPRTACCVVMASGGYPDHYEKGREITGLDKVADQPETIVFQAGAKRDDTGKLVTSGGRVLGVTGLGEDLRAARETAYRAVDMIQFQDVYFRRDIGAKGLPKT